MGTRSDVFVVIHKDLWPKVSHLGFWGDADAMGGTDHRAFLFTDIKWNRYDDESIQELYVLIEDQPELHWIVEACHDYPESSDGDSGEWSDNPWGGRRQISVTIDCSLES